MASRPQAQASFAGPIRVGAAPVERLTFDGDPGGGREYVMMLDRLSDVGVDLHPVELDPFLSAGRLLYEGAFLAQRYEAVGGFVDANRDQVDPVVGEIISAGAAVRGWEVFRDLAELERLRSLTVPLWERIDVLAVPTVPRLPALAEVLDDPLGPNRMLGHYTNFVNMLDLCAFTVPVTDGGSHRMGPPPSLTLIAPAWSDSLLIDLARRVTAAVVGS